MCFGKEYLQSMIMVSVSLSLASWKGAEPHTSIYKITPSDQMSGGDEKKKERILKLTEIYFF